MTLQFFLTRDTIPVLEEKIRYSHKKLCPEKDETLVIRKRQIRRKTPKVWVTANHQIRAAEVRVLDEKGGQLGVMPTKEAIEKARNAEKDLVLIADKAKPPVAKIIDISKYKYQQQQKQAESRKKAKSQDIKEVRFTPFMSDGDYQARLKKVEQFLKRGDKVRLSLQFKGRQITKKEFGYDMFNRVIEATSGYATVETEPKMQGRKLFAQLQPLSKKDMKKAEEKQTDTTEEAKK